MSTHGDVGKRMRERCLPFFKAPSGIRGGFEHYGTLVADVKENRARFAGKLPMPVLALAGEKDQALDMIVDSVARVARHPETDYLPGAGHTFAEDNAEWVADRLTRFLA